MGNFLFPVFEKAEKTTHGGKVQILVTLVTSNIHGWTWGFFDGILQIFGQVERLQDSFGFFDLLGHEF